MAAAKPESRQPDVTDTAPSLPAPEDVPLALVARVSLASAKSYYGAGVPGWFRGLFTRPTAPSAQPGTVRVAATSSQVSVGTTSASVSVSTEI